MKLSDIVKDTGGTVIDRLYRTKFNSPQEVVKFLKTHGFKKLGGGLYSDVYGRPQDKYVVKISKYYDPCFLKYSEWMASQTDNPYVPHFEWYKTYESIKGPLIILPVEKLRHLTRADFNNIEDPAICIGLLRYGNLYDADNDKLRKKLKDQGYLKGTLNFEISKELVKKFASHQFIQTIATIHKKFTKGGKCSLDLHAGNFMIRPSTNTIVITDPLSEHV